MTLIVLGSMMAAFRFASSEMATGRAMIELTNQLQRVEKVLNNDLDRLTVELRPYTERTFPMGNFEYIEGPMVDATVATNTNASINKNNYIGDLDDVLHFTARSKDVPFKGRYVTLNAMGDLVTEMVESSQAEIIYFAIHNDRNPPPVPTKPFFDDLTNTLLVDYDENVSLYRRVLLIRPDLAIDYTINPGPMVDEQVDQFFQTNDISTRMIFDGNGTAVLIANSLEDLSIRRNRFCHSGTPSVPSLRFPDHLDKSILNNRRMKTDPDPAADFSGEDILLTNVAAFDVRVFSPNAQVDNTTLTNGIISPGDVGFVAATAAAGPRIGAYVDLGYAAAFPPLIRMEYNGVWFADVPNTKSMLFSHPINGHVYDTWSPWYENNGENEDGIHGDDQAVNGFDDDGINGVDDNVERETMPPYGNPIRGLQVTLRIVEKINNRVEQSSITQSFVPE